MTYSVQGIVVTVGGYYGVYECEITNRAGVFIANGFSTTSEATAIKNAFNSIRNDAVNKYKMMKMSGGKNDGL